MNISMAPMCLWCSRYRDDMTCSAFPLGIPEDIWGNEFDHREAHAGDNGMVFDPNSEEAQRIVEERSEVIFSG